ncbi:hypothetical protein CRG98_003003 [Punica granatum]|uniref:Uncharacterized protein n=1 Tax=Punica granatum TaxID=22663 RepID=A0A2I0L7K6_PUNGR|nr:hypothetical protein CRG98_003003 [Punica granatum]
MARATYGILQHTQLISKSKARIINIRTEGNGQRGNHVSVSFSSMRTTILVDPRTKFDIFRSSFSVSVSIFTAFRTSCPRTSRPHFTAFITSHPRTSRPHLLLSGLRVHIYCFQDFASTDFASTFTAFRTSRPHLLLSGFRVHIYYFSNFVFTFTAFRSSCPPLSLLGLRVHIYRFLDFMSTFTAFWISRPRTSRPSLLLAGLRVHVYRFPDFASTFIALRVLSLHLLF